MNEMKQKEKASERVMIFIDGSNFYYSTSRKGLKVNFEKFVKRLSAGKELIRAFYYVAPLDYTNSEVIKHRIVAAILNRAVKRGGNWNNGANAGPFCANLNNAPTNTNYNIGFRCCSGFLVLAEFLRKFCRLEMQLQLQSALAENIRRNSFFAEGISPMNFNKEEDILNSIHVY